MKPIGYVSEYDKSNVRTVKNSSLIFIRVRKEFNYTVPIYDGRDVEASVRELVEALEAVAGEHMERRGYCQADCDIVPDLTRYEMQKRARIALARYRGEA